MSMGVIAGVVAVGSAGASVYAGNKQASAQKRARREQNALARNSFSNVNVRGPGGITATQGGAQIPGLQAGSIDFGQLAALGGGSSFSGGSPAGFSGGTRNIGLPAGTAPQMLGATNINPNSGAAIDPSGFTNDGQGFGSNIGAIDLGLGDLDPARAGLAQIALGNIGNAGLAAGVAQDPRVQALSNNIQGIGSTLGMQEQGALDALLGGAGFAFGGAQADLANRQANPFAQGLIGNLLGGAQAAQAGLPGTQAQARDEALALLRQQAQPEIERSTANFLEGQFARGQMGTTGGALQTEAFARGLARADTDRQLAAMQEGRSAQNAQLNLMNNQIVPAGNLAGLQNNLLTGATGRFRNVADLSRQLGVSATQNQTNRFNNAGAMLANLFAPQNLALGLQSGFLGNASSALGGVSGLQADAQALASLGLSAASNQAGARVGSLGGMAAPAPNMNSANAWASLSQAAGGLGGAFDAFRGVFSNPAATTGSASFGADGFQSTTDALSGYNPFG